MHTIKDEWLKTVNLTLLYKISYLGVIVEHVPSGNIGFLIIELKDLKSNMEFYKSGVDERLYLLPEKRCRILEFFTDDRFEGILHSIRLELQELKVKAAG